MLDFARAADAAGVDRLVVSDHVVFGEHLEEYANPKTGGIVGGKQPTGPDGHWLEPLTTLSVVAGMTRRIRLRTQIIIAALRRPVVLAKAAATLDVLSGGRLDLGVGVGWQRAEYEAAGLPFDGRGRLLDHTLDVCQTLWRDMWAKYESPELKFDAIHQMPKPLQPGGVPIWTSGTVRNTTARRIARYGARWIPWGPDAGNLAESIPRMKEAVLQEGGSVEGFQVVGALPVVRTTAGNMDVPRTMDQLPQCVTCGVTDFIDFSILPKSYDENLAELSPLVAAFRRAVGR
ncbi:MAG TPA: TIGR03619 family F420-dependent LLM class oxidoreductase [Terricaulis sp.]|nr:TIGR03619 family F420-dependent LLM class oxidoreductase [Terricaulis sp.]